MKLIVGLGNPGKQYQNTWHNIGFATLEKLSEQFGFSDFKKSVKFKAEITKGEVAGETIILVKPQTFMNNSGLSVAAIANFYKIKPIDIIVIQDDLDLAAGKLRLAKDSSAGGHNGIKSIIEQLGTKDFMRVKVGIKTELLTKVDPADYVLMAYKKIPEISKLIKTAAEATATIIETGLAKAMNKYN